MLLLAGLSAKFTAGGGESEGAGGGTE